MLRILSTSSIDDILINLAKELSVLIYLSLIRYKSTKLKIFSDLLMQS